MTAYGVDGPPVEDPPRVGPTAKTHPVERRRPAHSLLPGVAIVGVLLAGAIFAAGYSLGDSGRDSGARSGGQAIAEAYERIASDYVGEVDREALVGAAIDAMFESLGDPYSSYMGADRFEADLADVSGEFEGIGAQMSSEDASGEACDPIGDACRLRVIDVLPGSPAEDAGLLGGDVIRMVDQQPLDGLTMADTVGLIRGPSGTDVTLGVERGSTEHSIAITRELIRAQDVRADLLAGGRVGYLRVDTFSVGASDDFHQQLRRHLDSGVEGLIIDLRDDPGGFVDAAVTMASEFLADGPLYREEQAGREQRIVEARDGGLATSPGIGVAVLIDGGTASASEMLAGALGNRDRATLVGERTFGKGTIQEWTELPGDNGGFRLSIARWLLPDGTPIDGIGIPPDIEVASAPTATSLEEDPVVRAALDALLGDEPGAVAPSVDPARSAVPSPSSPPTSSPPPSN
jgi:carboxyl-terminal processing protease